LALVGKNPIYQMSASQIFERLHQEGYIKQTNIAKWYELKEEQEL